MSQEVASYCKGLSQEWQAELCQSLRRIIQQAIPDVVERLQYGKPHYLKNGKYVCVLATAKGWVSVTIFNAAALDVPAGVFEPGPPERKTLKLRPGQTIDNDLLTRLIQQAAQGR